MERKRTLSDIDEPNVPQTIKEIGESLRHRRKEMNVSIKEAENATSIRIVYLQALEDGELGKLISPVYAQGFFKQYAAFLGIDGESIVRQHPEIFNRPEPQEFAYGIGTLESRGNPGAGVKGFPSLLWILILLIVLVGAWYLTKFFGLI